MIPIRQTSFAGGELAEALGGRIDLARYMTSLLTCHNFQITKQGSLENRPGSIFVAATKTTGSSRLIPFNFGKDQSFVLEFGNLYVRFYHDGGLVMTGSPPAPLEVTTPFTTAELDSIKYAQSRDVIRITCPPHDPMELKRISNTNWVLETCSFVALSPARATASHPAIADMWIEYTPKDLSARAKIYDYGLSMVLRDTTTKRVTETQVTGFTGAEVGMLVNYQNNVTSWNSGTYYVRGDLARTGGAVYQCMKEHQNQAPGVGTIGVYWETIHTDVWVTGTTYADGDLVRDPDNSFFYLSLVNNNTGNMPHDSPSQWTPMRLYYLYDRGRMTYLPDMPLHLHWPGITAPTGYALVAYRLYRGSEDIVGGVSKKAMVLLAEINPWTTDFLDDGSTPLDVTQSPRTNENPLASDPPETVAYFDQRSVFGRRNEVLFSAVGDYYNLDKPNQVLDDSPTRLILASELYEEIRWLVSLRALLAGTSATVPYVLGGKGGAQEAFTAASFSLRGQERWGASWLDPLVVRNQLVVLDDTGESVLSIKYDYSSDGYSSQDLSVIANHLTEGDPIIRWCYARSPNSTIWAVTQSGRLLGLTYFPEQDLIGWHWHSTTGKYLDVCAVLEGATHAVYALVERVPTTGTVKYVERFASRKILSTTPSYDWIFLDSALKLDSPTTVTVITGLDHLEGLEVGILADGEVGGKYTVASGQIDISAEWPDGVNKATVGLPYVSELETLDAVDKNKDITTLKKRVLAVQVRVRNSRGFEINSGSYHTSMKWIPWMQREVAMGYTSIPLASGEFRVGAQDNNNFFGRARVRQTDPLPLTILAVQREVEIGDR